VTNDKRVEEALTVTERLAKLYPTQDKRAQILASEVRRLRSELDRARKVVEAARNSRARRSGQDMVLQLALDQYDATTENKSNG
jgi:hypothetical protein